MSQIWMHTLTRRLRVILWCEGRDAFLTNYSEIKKWARDTEPMNPYSTLNTWFSSDRTYTTDRLVGGSFCWNSLALLNHSHSPAALLLMQSPLTQDLSFPSPPLSVWHSGVIYLYQERQLQCFTGGHSGILNRQDRVPQVPWDVELIWPILRD